MLLIFMLFIIFVFTSMIVGSLMNSNIFIIEWNLMGITGTHFPVILIIDKFSAFMSFTVILISLSVMIFSKSYMSSHKSFSMFFFILLLFVSSMLLLTLSPGLISLFFGWDGLGLASFMLILSYSNTKSLVSALLTVIANRVGDAMMLSALALMMMGVLTNPSLVYMSYMSEVYPQVFLFLFIVGASTKSAQLPFSAWLPAAMAAPTPVSALVHSSTLVTAGVYVMIRFSAFTSYMAPYLMLIGSLTTLMASLSALKEPDMKKIVALSTLSQLGIMVSALGAGSPTMSFFHLTTHAYFKALMFISVGDFIHTTNSYQDLKLAGGYSSLSPITSAYLVAAKLALCGLPFFSGYFSKEFILENLFTYTYMNITAYLMMFFSIMMTVLYSIRFIMKVIVKHSNLLVLSQFNNLNPSINTAMFLLLLPGIMGGMIFNVIFSEDLITSITPAVPKALVLLSMMMAVFIMASSSFLAAITPHRWDKMFFLWMSPEGPSPHKFLNELPSKINLNLLSSVLSFYIFKNASNMVKMVWPSWGFNESSIIRISSSLMILMILISI